MSISQSMISKLDTQPLAGRIMDLFATLRNMKILLIDDDEWIRDSMTFFFESEGCRLTTLETAEEGLAFLKDQICDIIICDYRLPGMDGLAFFKRIQTSQPDALKILITAYGSRKLVADTIRNGIQDYIQKPFEMRDIENSLSRLIADRG